MSPHSVRDSRTSLDGVDSICLGEIAYALFSPPPQPVIPVMVQQCEAPLSIFHLDYTDMTALLAQSDASSQRVTNVLLEKSQGNFLYVKQALNALEREQYSFAKLDELPRGLSDLYLVYFERNFPDEASFQAVRSLLEVIVAAAEPLTREQLANATGLEPKRELSGVLRRLSAYLRLQTDAEGVKRYTVYHKSLADWLTDSDRAGAPYSIDPREGHQQLSAAGLREFEKSPASMSPYAVAHLPAHLIAAEQWDELEAVLTDISFLEAKTTAGLTFDLAGDFKLAAHILSTDSAPWLRTTCCVSRTHRFRNQRGGHPRRQTYSLGIWRQNRAGLGCRDWRILRGH